MKEKALKRRSPYFFGQRIHGMDSSGNMLGLTKPESGWERPESGIMDLLRWADDGGNMVDLENRTSGSN
jgi:hypothetical protein